MSELEEEAKELAVKFMNDPTVQRYLKAKKAYEDDPSLSRLRDEVEKGKKNLKFLSQEDRNREFVRLRKIQSQIDNDELTLNYQELKAEAEEMFTPIRSLFENL